MPSWGTLTSSPILHRYIEMLPTYKAHRYKAKFLLVPTPIDNLFRQSRFRSQTKKKFSFT